MGVVICGFIFLGLGLCLGFLAGAAYGSKEGDKVTREYGKRIKDYSKRFDDMASRHYQEMEEYKQYMRSNLIRLLEFLLNSSNPKNEIKEIIEKLKE